LNKIVPFISDLEEDEYFDLFGIKPQKMKELIEFLGDKQLSKKISNEQTMQLYHIWIKHHPSRIILNTLFGISESHRYKLIKICILECFEFAKLSDNSPLKIPSPVERKNNCAILEDPRTNETVKITMIIDGTEQLAKKTGHFLGALNEFSGKKSTYTVQKLVGIK
jgi:hypothetical protein